MFNFVVQLGTHVVKQDFIVCQKLAAPVVLEFAYKYRLVDASKSSLSRVELDNASSNQLLRTTLNRASRKKVPLLAMQELLPVSCQFTKLRGTVKVSIPLESQVWMHVSYPQQFIQEIQPLSSFYENA